MSFDHGPMQYYEITWRSGHIETIRAQQVSWPGNSRRVAVGLFGVAAAEPERPTRIHFHAEIDGQWCLTLAADEEDIASIRLVTQPEQISEAQL